MSRAPSDFAFDTIPITDLPVYSYDLDPDFPPAATAFKKALVDHRQLLFVTPEYNRSIPGALKNALDWGSRPWGDSFAGCRAAIAGTGLNGAGSAVAQAHPRSILGYLQVSVLGAEEVCLPWTDGVLHSPRMAELVDAFWESVRAALPD